MIRLGQVVSRTEEVRDFTEVDLRHMLGIARRSREDVVGGRWVIETKHRGRPWAVIVEPDPEEQLLVVITAYGA